MKLLFFSLSLLASFSAFAQDDIELSGQILNPNSKYVQLSRFSGIMLEDTKRDSAKLDDQGRFSFTLPWPEAREASFQAGEEVTTLFLTPGDRIVLTLDTKEFDESVKYTGRGSIINSYEAKRLLLNEKGERYLMMAAKKPEAEFVRIADSARTAELALLQQHFGSKPGKAELAFINRQKADLTYDWALRRLDYPMMHRGMNKSKEETALSPGYYSFLNEVSLQPDQFSVPFELFAGSYASYLAKEAIRKQPALKEKNRTLLEFEQVEQHFKGQPKRLVMAFLLNQAIMFSSEVAPLRPAYERFLKEPGLESELKESISRKFTGAEKLAAGNAAPDFTALTTDGKSVKLSDFKGKVVFVDVWASWCGPCIQEVPAAKELETAFHGKDVVFLNVCIDDDQAAWKKALEKHGIQGVNAWMKGWKSEIAQKYNINAIPRYLLIDRKGNMISSNAERPSGGAKQAIADALASK